MKITIRMWIMFIFIIFALISVFSIPPKFLEKGLIVNSVEENTTIFNEGLRKNMIITSINDISIKSLEDYSKAMSIFSDNQVHKLDIKTDVIEIIGLFAPDIISQITVEKIPKTRINTGLDIQGGARALITAQDIKLTDSQLNDLIAILQERLNIYGVSDVKINQVSDLSGNRFILIEIAGSSPSDLENLITQQGMFEAKIGNETVFVGGKEDITYVGRSGQDAGIYECFLNQGREACNFRFVIYLSEKAAQRHADITKDLAVNGSYLEKQIEFYVDGKLATAPLNIGVDLKGKIATQIQISGSETGNTRQEAIDNSKAEMKKLQTILITGSLPFKLKIEKIDKISPALGENFSKTLFIAALLATLGVFLIIFIRYRKIKVSFIIIFTVASEILIILGISAIIKWNIDLPSIAGIIAAIGTGVDDQIVIVDESTDKRETLKIRIRNALFIIFTAYATAVVSLLPLYWAGAGLLKGFAVTSLIGITAGVLITRPAFADVIKQLEGE